MLKHWLETRTVSRRAALLGGSAVIATAAVTTGGTAHAQATGHSGHATRHPGMLGTRIRTPEARAQAALARNAQAPALTADPLPMPPVLSLASGPGTLPMKAQDYQLGDRPAKNLRVYDNGSAPQYLMGPTLEMAQTGSFTVTLANRLPLNPDQDQPHIVNIPSQFNTTNLHTHGLHVSPNSPGDNVYLEVLPQGTDAKYADGVTSFVGDFTYTYDLSNHTPGTFWYHPHRHGSVAVQVASGAAGALIVRGGAGTVDTFPGINGITEQVLLIQQVLLNANGELPDFDTIWNATPPVAVADWTVNGTIGRTLPMQPGEVQRWRIVNTGFQTEARFSLAIGGVQTAGVAGSGSFPEMDVTLIAMDGVNFTTAATVKAVYLPPGGRADILVKAPDAPGRLLAQAGPYIKLDANQAPEEAGIQAGFEIGGVWQETPFQGTPTVLFTVNVAGAAKPMSLPSNPLPKPLVPDITAATQPDNYRYVNFDVTSFTSPQVPPPPANSLPSYNPGAVPQVFKLQINGELFCPGRIMFQPSLDSVDQYFVDSPGLHVFHIHVNPFLVTEVNGKPLSTPMWRDTMLAGPNGYKALTKYTDYSGSFPIHCHILDHEDAGMMTNVTVVDKANPAGSVPRHGKH
ncbi:multicopper oxidase family protein [Azospirillum doebereinerae]|uniref:multicopper oxidase family protein n=1 Tax=Azospirillum doebereinerae TaxID=92933 RepID=UPI001EE50E72|nr:multicopper oxidase domain-containing protein [Azospirillum doebereinerae]MCG5240487.1 multicopper oxidase domain-containing protein [Azospirillum doebereinerae]